MVQILERSLKLKGMDPKYPIIQGGMGIGVSLYELASAVGREGCIGTISSAALDQFVRKRLFKKDFFRSKKSFKDLRPGRMDFIESVSREVYDTKKNCGVAAINIMVALPNYFESAIQGAVEGGVDMIVCGAGLPLNLPSLVGKYAGRDHDISLVPIVSSGRALELICKKWDKLFYRPDGCVLEGPKAGGHLGWRYNDISDDFLEKFDLFDNLLDPVLDVADKYPNDFGSMPVIVAGGIYNNEDIVYALSRGASGVQMGSRFAATKESGFSDISKQVIVDSSKEDIVIADQSWGSPCGYPFRYSKLSPAYINKGEENNFCICSVLSGGAGIDNSSKLGRKDFPKGCPERYVLIGDRVCPGVGHPSYDSLVTMGSEAYRINEVLSVKELCNELKGF
jgi:nitronate monooxygenase